MPVMALPVALVAAIQGVPVSPLGAPVRGVRLAPMEMRMARNLSPLMVAVQRSTPRARFRQRPMC